MLTTLLVFALTFVLLFLTGFISWNLWNRHPSNAHTSTPAEYFFAGFFVLSALSAWLSVFFPLTPLLGLVLAGILVALSFRIRGSFSDYTARLFQTVKHTSRLAVAAFALTSAYLVVVACGDISNYDTGLYHAQSVKWIAEYSVVPGLGNLHGRFAFNSHFFPISALFAFDLGDTLFEHTSIIFPVNPVCTLVLLLTLLSLWMNPVHDAVPEFKIGLLVVFLCICFTLLVPVNSLSPDVISAVITIVAFLSYLDCRRQDRDFSFFLLTAAVFTGVTYKLSLALLAFLLVPVLLRNFQKKRLYTTVLLFAFIVFPFFIRNYYLSGYLLYPFSSLDLFHPDWKIPVEAVELEKLWIKAWAKMPSTDPYQVESLPLSAWLPGWFAASDLPTQCILLVSSLLPLFFVRAILKKDWNRAVLMGVVLVNLAFWFVSAPNFRFAFGFFFAASALSLSSLISGFLPPGPSFFPAFGNRVFAVCFMGIVGLNYPLLKFLKNRPDTLLFPVGLGKGKAQKIHTPFALFQPLEDDRCFLRDLPCTPYPNPKLGLRGNTIQEGFRIKN